jgi:GWxTD domain-containing protein
MTRSKAGFIAFLPLVLAAAGQKLTKEEERWLERDVRAIVTDEEANLFRKLATSEERARFQEIFWARRDPAPRTRENEFREDFEQKIEIADSRFRARVGPGSATDMGVVFLVLGYPANVETGRGVVELDPGREGGIPESLEGSSTEEAPPGGRGAAGEPEDSPQRIQTWHYSPNEALGIPEGLEVKFRAQPGYGYRLVRSKEVDRFLEARRGALIVRPEIQYALDAEGRLLPTAGELPASAAARLLDELMSTGIGSDAVSFRVTPGFFRSHQETVYVPLLFELANDGPAEVTFFGAVSQDERVVARFEERVSLAGAWGSFEMPLQLAPGDYLVHVGVVDEATGESGSRASSLQVASFEPGDFTTSSVVLHAGAVRSDEIGGAPGRAFQFGSFDLAPRSHHPFFRAESLGIFYYVYGAANDPATGKPRVSARYLFLKDEKEVAQTSPRLLAATDGQAVASDEIPLASFEPGEYRLRVVVRDEIAGKAVERRSTFRVAP